MMASRGRRIEAKLDLAIGLLRKLIQQEDETMALIDDLLADVEDETTVVASIETLLDNLSAMIAAAGTDPAKLAQIKTVVDTNKARLSAAAVKNTPAAPTP